MKYVIEIRFDDGFRVVHLAPSLDVAKEIANTIKTDMYVRVVYTPTSHIAYERNLQ